MAWTVTPTHHNSYTICHPLGNEMVVFKLACTSDASGLDKTISEVLGNIHWLSARGGWLYSNIIIVGTGDDAPSGTFNYDWQNEFDMSKISVTDHAVDENTENTGSDEFGRFAVVEDKDHLVIDTLGDGNKADIYIYVMKG